MKRNGMKAPLCKTINWPVRWFNQHLSIHAKFKRMKSDVCAFTLVETPRSGNLCSRVFTDQLIPTEKYACPCSEAESIKFIKVT